MASVQYRENGNGLLEKTDKRDDSESVLLDPCLWYVAHKASRHFLSSVALTQGAERTDQITRGPGLG